MATRTIRTLARLCGLFLAWQVVIRLGRKLFHFPAPALVGRFLDSDLRRRLQHAETILRHSGIEPGMHVLDLGCGSGALTTYAARAVGSQGLVYALDVQPEMLAQLRLKLGRPEYADIQNVEIIEHAAQDLPFPDSSLDAVYMVTVLQEIAHPETVLAEIRRVLKPNGVLGITEFLPDPDYVLPGTTIKLGLASGLHLKALEGNLWSYTARFTR